ncbi:MAG: N-6 DNA methylase [Planctomycetota bacterium]
MFTPRLIADWMAKWVCQESPRSALDPAVGPGVFVDAFSALPAPHRPSELHVIDIDPVMIDRFEPPPGLRCTKSRADFITTPIDARYDAIIANPPYVRHHDLSYSKAVWRDYDRICNRSVSRMTNLYGLFIIKIASLLAHRGRAAIITPSEWLGADFGVAIKDFLLRHNLIDAMIQFDHASNVFDGVLTTAAITLLRRDRAPHDVVRFAAVSDVRELQSLDLNRGVGQLPTDLIPHQKWTPLFKGESLGKSKRSVRDIAVCTRGIATGANDYFTLRPSDLRHWKISRRDVRTCITKARQISDTRFTMDHLKRLIANDERVFLLHPRQPLLPAITKYLAHGRKQAIDRRYLPSHRPIWYAPEHRNPAPILVTVFARGDFRFVWNEAGVQNLTAYHGIYPRDGRIETAKTLFRYLTSPTARQHIHAHARHYADGLFKVEPKDVEAVAIPTDLTATLARPRSAKKRASGSQMTLFDCEGQGPPPA